MQYVVDESVMDFNGHDAEYCYEVIESVLDRVDDILLSDQICYYSEDLFNLPVHGGLTLWELCGAASPIPLSYEVQTRLAVAFSRLQVWSDGDDPVPEYASVAVNGQVIRNSRSLAWAHHKTSRDIGDAVACVAGSGRSPSGYQEVSVDGRACGLWFISTGRDDENLFRWIISNSTTCPSELEGYAPMAFRGLDFVAGSFNGIKGMSKPYRNLLPVLMRHLSALSDEGRRIFRGPWEDAEGEFGSLGVNLSDENGNTKKNSRAKQERTVQWAGKARVVWWHTKLERNQDRIHFCPEGVAKNENILVGVFCFHLTT